MHPEQLSSQAWRDSPEALIVHLEEGRTGRLVESHLTDLQEESRELAAPALARIDNAMAFDGDESIDMEPKEFSDAIGPYHDFEVPAMVSTSERTIFDDEADDLSDIRPVEEHDSKFDITLDDSDVEPLDDTKKGKSGFSDIPQGDWQLVADGDEVRLEALPSQDPLELD